MKIGFIGLGIMGANMALHIRSAGHDVVVNDLRRDAAEPHLAAGCTWAASCRQVAETSDVVLTSLPGPREIEAIALGEDGLLASMRRGTTWIDLSTNSPALIRRLHERFASKGVGLLDAPVSGGPTGAKSGKLAIWVGGDRKEFDRYKSLLDTIGDQVEFIGSIGSGTIAKLVYNCAGYAIQTVEAEIFTMGVKAGVEPAALYRALRHSGRGRSRTFDLMARQFLPGVFDPPAFALRLALKDVTLATDLAREMNVPMRLANLAREDMTEALNRGWGERDSRVSMLLQEERAGVKIAMPREEIKKIFDEDPG